MNKKRVVLISKTQESIDAMKGYVEGLGHEAVLPESDKVMMDFVKSSLDRPFHIGPFVVGVAAMSMAGADAICLEPHWEESEYCKDLHLLAFKYGLEILFAPEG